MAGEAALDGGGDDASPNRLGEEENTPNLGALVLQHTVRVYGAGDGVAELHLGISASFTLRPPMTAQLASSIFERPPAIDGRQHIKVALPGKLRKHLAQNGRAEVGRSHRGADGVMRDLKDRYCVTPRVIPANPADRP
jgi:hypothetical protein